MKNPVLYTLIAYIIGIFCAYILDFSIAVFFIITVILFSLIKQTVSKRLIPIICLIASAFILGNIAYFIAYTDPFSPLAEYSGEYITATGRMCEVPQYDSSTGLSQFTIITNDVEYKGIHYSVKDKIRISVHGRYTYALTVRVSGFLKEFDERGNSVGYDSKMQNKIRHISYKLFADISDVTIVQKHTFPNSLYDAYNMLKYKSIEIINLYFTDENAALLRIILFGDYRNINETFSHNLNKSGAVRFLRSSYLMILIISSLSEFFSLKLSVPKKYRIFITSVCILIFVMLNSSSPSFIRTGIFFVVYLLYTHKYGYLYIPDAMSSGIFIILIINPLLVFSSCFVFSVTSCIMIFLFGDHIKQYIRQNIRFLKDSTYITGALSVWTVCTVTLLPLHAYYYNNLSIYTLIFSVIFPALILAVLICMPPVIILLSLVHTAPLLYQIILCVLFVIRKTIELVCELPYHNIILSKPNNITIAVFFIALYIIWLKLENEADTVLYKILCTFCLIFSVFITSDYCLHYNDIAVHFINVGQGDSALIEIKGKENILIDGGGSAVYSDYKTGEEIVVPYIEAKSGGRLDTVIVSHYHKDHCDGIIDVLSEFDVKRIIMPDCEPDNEYRILIEETAENTGCEIIYAKRGLNVEYPSGLRLKILLPDNELLKSDDLNSTSLVTLVSYGDFDALFMGDMTADGEMKLINKNIKSIKNIELLKTGHHGSDTSSVKNFLEYTSPIVSIVSVGKNNSYNLPSHEVISRLKDNSGIVLRTDKNGDITVRSDKNGLMKIDVMKK